VRVPHAAGLYRERSGYQWNVSEGNAAELEAIRSGRLLIDDAELSRSASRATFRRIQSCPEAQSFELKIPLRSPRSTAFSYEVPLETQW